MFRPSFLFGLIYTACLVLSVVNPVILVSGVPLRFIFVAALIVLCVFYRQHRKDWFVRLYAAYLFFVFVAGATSGYVNDTVLKLIGTYLVSLVMYSATVIMVRRFNNINWITFILMLLFVADAVVTIGQYYQNSFCMALPTILGFELKDSLEVAFYNSIEMEGVQMIGIVGAVANGYILSVATILSWNRFESKNMLLVNVVLWAICLLASFYSQERAGFYLAILFSVYLIFLMFRTNKGLGRVFVVALILVIAFSTERLLETVTTTGRYTMGLEGQDRLDFIQYGVEFIAEHPLGGIDLYTNRYHWMPHNLFTNMFIAGGWIGGTILMGIVVSQLYKCGIFILKTDKKANWQSLLYVLMYINITAQSFVHNYSIVYGSTLFFIIWGVISCFVDSEKQHKTSFKER